MPKEALSMDHWKAFGAWVGEKRRSIGKSKTQAALDAGMDRSQWGRIESGVSGTRRETIPRIAQALKQSVPVCLKQAGFSTMDETSTTSFELVSIVNIVPSEKRSGFIQSIKMQAELLRDNQVAEKESKHVRDDLPTHREGTHVSTV